MDKPRLCNRRLQRAIKPERGVSTASPRSKAPIAPTERAAAIRRRASHCTAVSQQRQPHTPVHHEPQRRVCHANHCAAEPQQRQPRPGSSRTAKITLPRNLTRHGSPNRKGTLAAQTIAPPYHNSASRAPAHLEPQRSLYRASRCAIKSRQHQPRTPAHHEPQRCVCRASHCAVEPHSASRAPAHHEPQRRACRASRCAIKSHQRQPRPPAHHEPQRRTCRASRCAAESQQRQPRPPAHHKS